MTPTPAAVLSTHGLSTTIAWALDREHVTYALEGNISVTGAAVQWLGEFLNLEDPAEEVAKLAARVESAGGLYLVPAFVGLGAPYWNDAARGLISGITRGSTATHLARATIETIAYQVRDVVMAMENDTGRRLTELRVDGGVAANDYLMQFQADLLQCPVRRPRMAETTALGAAMLAGISAGIWHDAHELISAGKNTRLFVPEMSVSERDQLMAGWHRAVNQVRSRG